MSGEAGLTEDTFAGGERLAIMDSIVSRMNGFLYRCRNDADFTMLFMEGAVESVTGYSQDRLAGMLLCRHHPSRRRRLSRCGGRCRSRGAGELGS